MDVYSVMLTLESIDLLHGDCAVRFTHTLGLLDRSSELVLSLTKILSDLFLFLDVVLQLLQNASLLRELRVNGSNAISCSIELLFLFL